MAGTHQIFKHKQILMMIDSFTSSDAIHDDAFQTNIKNSNINHFVNSIILDFAVTTYHYIQHECHRLLANGKTVLHMECCHLNLVTLGSTMEEVYSAFFYSLSRHTLHQQSDKILFGHFVMALNAAFD